MPSTNVPDTGIELTADDTVRTATFNVPSRGWIVSNTGTKALVVNFDAKAAPIRTQPDGASGRYLAAGTSCAVPETCAALTYQDSVDGQTSYLLISKG